MSKIELTSKQFRLNVKDFLRGFLMAAISAAIMTAQVVLASGSFNPQIVWMSGLAGGLAYLTKNFFQTAQVKQDITNEQHDEMSATPETAAK